MKSLNIKHNDKHLDDNIKIFDKYEMNKNWNNNKLKSPTRKMVGFDTDISKSRTTLNDNECSASCE